MDRLMNIIQQLQNGELPLYEANLTPADVFALEEMAFNLNQGETVYSFISTPLKEFLERNGYYIQEDEYGNYWINKEDIDQIQ